MKRIISIVVMLAILLGAIPIGVFATGTDTTISQDETTGSRSIAPDSVSEWDGTIASGFARGDGSENYPYIIETASQLAYLAQSVNNGNSYSGKYIDLVSDIDLNEIEWTPIGETLIQDDFVYSPFAGVFDGNGHTVYGFRKTTFGKYLWGFFGRNDGEIKNLNIIDAELSNNSDGRVIAGILVHENHGTIINCDVSGTISDCDNVGGISFYNYGNVVQCTADVSIDSDNFENSYVTVGCLVGWNSGTIDSCRSFGSITVSNAKYGGEAGGLAGTVGMIGGTISTVSNSYSTASVIVRNASSQKYSNLFVGGLIGAGGNCSVVNCYATGTVNCESVTGENFCVGGLIGNAESMTVRKCYAGNNSLTATIVEVSGYDANVGRLIGYGGSCADDYYVNRNMVLTRSRYVAEYTSGSGCNATTVPAKNEIVNTPSENSETTIDSRMFTYGSHEPRKLIGWGTYSFSNASSDPWIDNGNNPILYFEKNVGLTVRYICDGEIINESYKETYPGQAVSISTPKLLGYTADKDIISMTLTADTVADVTYSRVMHNVNIVCKDQDGNLIKTETTKATEGLPFTLEVPQIEGYTPRNNEVSGNMGTEDITIDVVYDVNTYTVDLQYLYIEEDELTGGITEKTLSASYSTSRKYGEEIIIEAPQVLGYKIITQSMADFIITEGTIVIPANCAKNINESIIYSKEDVQWYTIATMLGDTPIQDVSVTLDGEEKKTDKNGRAMFSYEYGTEKVSLTIHKDGFSSGIYELETNYYLKTNLGIDYFDLEIDTADHPDYSVQGVSCFGNDIDKDYGIINVKYDGPVPIVVKGNISSSDKIVKMQLVQEVDSTKISSSDSVVEEFEDGTKVRKILKTIEAGDSAFEVENGEPTGVCVFKMTGTQFSHSNSTDYPIYVYMYTEYGNEPVIQKLKINTIKLSTNFKFDGLFDGASVSLSGTGLSFLDGAKLSFGLNDKYKVGSPFSIEVKNNEIYVAYDLSDEFEEEFKSISKETEKDYKELRNAEKRANDFMEGMAKKVDKKFAKGSWRDPVNKSSFSIDASAAGGMCFTIYEGGAAASYSYFKLGLAAKASWTSDFVVVFVPITIEVSISAEGEVTITGLGYDFEHQKIIWPSYEASLTASLKLSAGLGNRFASVGAFGRISVGTTLVIGERTYFDALILSGSAGFYAKLDLGLLRLYGEKSWTFLDKKITLAPRGSIKTFSATAIQSPGYLGEFNGLPVYESSAYTLMENVEEIIPEWDATGNVLEAPGVEFDGDRFKAVDSANGRIVSIDNQKIAIYFAHSTEREIANAKVLVYRVYDNATETWSEAQCVDDNGTGDTSFDVIEYQGKIYIAYNEANCIFDLNDYTDDAALIDDMTFAQDIKIAVYDSVSKSFVSFTEITTDSDYDTLPAFGIANDILYLAWNKNTSHDSNITFCMNTDNYVWYTYLNGEAWAEPQVAINKCYPIVDMIISEISGAPYISLIIDEDVSLYTDDDRNLYISDLYGKMTHINCYGSMISELKSEKLYGIPSILWKSNDKVMALSSIDASPYAFTGESVSIGDEYKYINLDENLSALIWKSETPEPNDIPESLSVSGTMGYETRIETNSNGAKEAVIALNKAYTSNSIKFNFRGAQYYFKLSVSEDNITYTELLNVDGSFAQNYQEGISGHTCTIDDLDGLIGARYLKLEFTGKSYQPSWDIHVMYKYGNNEWTSPTVMTTVPYHMMSFDVISESERFDLLFTDTYMMSNENNIEQNLSSYSKLCYNDFSWKEILTLNESGINVDKDLNKVEVNVTISNDGAYEIEKVSVKLTDIIKTIVEVPGGNIGGDIGGSIRSVGGEVSLASTESNNVTEQNFKETKNHYPVGEFTVNLLPGQSTTITAEILLDPAMSLEDYHISVEIAKDVLGGDTTIQGPPSSSITLIETVYPDLSVVGEYIIIGETEYVSIRVENIGEGTASGSLELLRIEEDGSESSLYSVDIVGLMTNNVKYYLIKLDKDFFKATCEDFKCVVVCNDDSNQSNNSTTILARKLEGAEGTEKDILVEVPVLSEYQQTFDKYTPVDIVLNITTNDDLRRYVGCIDENQDPVSPTLIENGNLQQFTFAQNELALLENGIHEFSFIYLTQVGYIDVIYTLNVIDSTPILITGNVSIVAGADDEQSLATTCSRGTILTVDISSVNTDQLSYEWIVDGIVVSTDNSYKVGDKHLGSEIYAVVTGVTPYYGTIASQKVYMEKVARSLDAPTILPESSDRTITLQKVFHVGDDQLKYGYSSINDGTSVENWQESNELTLPENGTYYLFAMAPGSEVYAPVISEGTEYSTVLTGIISGTVTSFNSNTDTVTIQLIEEGHTEVAYEVTTTGNSATYSITDVVAGTYTMKVSKNNHVTREYTVVVGIDDVTQDAKIHLKGDITGDGKITIADVNKANLHYKNKSKLSGYELSCAEVSGDTKISIADVNKLNLHYKGKSKLW